jgi:glucosyl-dolichyl phosphate glucuronosyltransferase
MNISVILCTFNRCQSLSKALDSLAASVLSETIQWEVLVVDNNSTDQTKEVVEGFCRRYSGRFRYLFEPRQGKSYALNAGIREARGKILAFTDDDVTVEPDWLQNLTADLHDSQWAGSGGRILPARNVTPPPWLALEGQLNQLGALCAYCDPGDAPGDLKSPPYGANMAFRREMFDRYGHFRIDLGPRPDSRVTFEDVEFAGRLMAAGERLRYAPSAVVYHEINPNRLRKDYFLQWWFDFGRGSVRQTGKSLGTWEILKSLGRTVLWTPRWLLTSNSQRRFYRKCWIWLEVGKLVESCQQAARASAPRTQSEVADGHGTPRIDRIP